MKRLTLGLASLLLMASAARADWQATKWGMTPPQVKAVLHGTATEVPESERAGKTISLTGEAALLSAPWKSGDFQFIAHFFFSTKGRLSRVKLTLLEGDRNRLLGELRAKYGKAFSSENSIGLLIETWHTAADSIGFIGGVGGGLEKIPVELDYSPLMNEDNGGL